MTLNSLQAGKTACVNALISDAIDVLRESNAEQKAKTAMAAANRWRMQEYSHVPSDPLLPPDSPSRPEKPILGPPSQVPKRRLGSKDGRLALIHAVAHIELNAIDLAWDLIARYGRFVIDTLDLGTDFLDDWVQVGQEESSHFLYLNQRLEELNSYYGAEIAHSGLWDAALATKHDLLARLSIVPMVLEARGLDVNPSMSKRLRSAGDSATADILDLIYQEEIGHVKIGSFWFHKICARQDRDAKTTFESNLRNYFKGQLKPPFNTVARELAGLPRAYYERDDQKYEKQQV